MEKLVTCAVVCAFCISAIYCQLPDERGIIMSVYLYSSFDKVKHLGKFPGYETINISNIDGITEGAGFTDSKLDIFSVDVDFATKTTYLYDEYYRAVLLLSGYNKDLDTTSMAFEVLHYGISEGSVQLAVDWLSHNLYFCDSVFRWIVAKPISDDKKDKDYYKIIVSDLLDSPGGVAVDPMAEYLFWSDMGRNDQNAKIERSGLLGQDRMTIHIPDVNPPSHMDVDRKDSRVYWIQRKSESLLWASYDGQEVRHVTRYEGSTLYDIAIFRDVVYMSDERNDLMYTVDKDTGQEMEKPISYGWYTIYGLAVYSEETQPQRDRDYCAEKNCDQLCFSSQTGATCDCSEGYIYNGTTEKCQADTEITDVSRNEMNGGLHKSIVFASRTHICLVDIRSFAEFYYDSVCKFTVPKQNAIDPDTGNPTDPAVPAEDKIKMFDLNMNEVTVYYASMDNKIYARSLIQPIENEGTDLIARADGNISGLAYDAEDGNLYWSEIDTGKINRVNVKTKTVKLKVNNATIEAPRNLLVLQEQRRLAWVSGQTWAMAIQTMNMDGTDLFDVINGFYEIGAITVDQERQIFYFLEPSERMVYSIPIDGSETPTTIYSSIDESAYLILHYNNFLSWVYMYSGLGHAVGMYNYVDETLFGDGYFDTESFIADIKVLDVKLQTPSRTSPCAFKNGGCEHFCITKHVNNQMAKICECRLGFRLQDDDKSCKTEVDADMFIVAADWTLDQVVQFHIETNSINIVPIMQDNKLLMGVFFDAEKHKIIWSELSDDNVYSANLNGTDKEILSNLRFEWAYRFTKDTVNGNIYYTGYSPPHIGVITPSGYAITLNDDFLREDLGAIAVHPEKGWLYFTATDNLAYIARSNMDGTDTMKIITGEHVQSPYGLAIDYENERLYWSDSGLDTIQRCNFDGENCTTIVNITDGGEVITDIATDGDYLYYSAYKISHIVQVSLTEPYTRTAVGYDVRLGKLDNIALYRSDNKNTQPVGGGCVSNGGLGDCSTFCFPTSTGRTCACKLGIELKDDNKTCSDVYQCTAKIKNVTAPSSYGVIDIKLPSTCTRRNQTTCDYECPPNFVRTNKDDVTLTCTEDGWDRESNLCEELLCPNSIENGTIDANCTRKVGEICDFTCGIGFTKTEDNTFCTTNGTWHKNVNAYCTPYMCTDTFKQPTPPSVSEKIEITFASTCSRQVNERCNYVCPTNYRPTEADNTALTCTATGWERATTQLCTKILCPLAIDNGTLESGCQGEIGKVCKFSCVDGFTKKEERTFCTGDGTWHQSGNAFCLETVVTPAPQTKDTIPKNDAIIIIVVCAIVIAILAAVLAVLICRNMRNKPRFSKNEGTASYHKRPKTRENISRASSVNDSYIQPRLSGVSERSTTPDRGHVNPMYTAEPLPGISHFDPSKDKSTISYERWMRDRRSDY